MTADIANYLKFASAQMAAESLFKLQPNTAPGVISTSMDALSLIQGNNRSSKFTTTQAEEFTNDWAVVEHISNTPTGFSGTLFKALRTDAARGITAGELVMSFRTTEFADDREVSGSGLPSCRIGQAGLIFGHGQPLAH